MRDSGVAVIDVSKLKFGWKAHTPILDVAQLSVSRGERVFIHGPSGSGKTTLLSVLGCIVRPQFGNVRLFSQDIGELSSSGRDRFRVDHIGFLFQMFNLIPYLSVINNVILPCRFSEQRMENAGGRNNIKDEARRLLKHLELTDDLYDRKATELSVGQQQRVAAARALIGQPGLIIADEPTSALDSDTRGAFLDLLFTECQKNQTTILFVSHDMALAPHFDRQIALTEINDASESAA